MVGSVGMLVAALLGCGQTARQKVDGAIVDDVRFEGNGGLWSGDADYLLRKHVAQRGSPLGLRLPVFNTTIEPGVYDPEGLVADGYRLEVWYAHNGWFDARFDGWEVRRVARGTRRRAAIVDVVGHVVPGPRSTVRDLELVGLRPTQRTLGEAVVRAAWLEEGQPFLLDSALYVRDALRASLRDNSYPYATVEVAVDAYPEERAVDVDVVADPGVSARLGAIAVSGNVRVPAEVILDESRLVEGDRWSARDLADAQARLYQLGAFSVVAVEPDLSDPTATRVSTTIRVVEGRFRAIRAGAGFATDGTAITPRLSAEFHHLNAFDRLVRLDARVSLGAAYRLGAEGARPRPVFLAEVGASHPRLAGSRLLGGSIVARIEQDLRNGQFAYRSPQLDASITWRPGRHLSVTAGPHYERYRWLDLSGNAGIIASVLFGEGFRNPYELATFDVGVGFDNRDDPLSPTRGRYLQLSVRQAVPFGPEGFFYTDVTADARIYRALRQPRDDTGWHRLVASGLPDGVSARISGRLLQPWGGRPLPYPELAFLGGASDLRGFFNDQVGPYDCFCLYSPSSEGNAFLMEPKAGTTLERFYPARGGAVSAFTVVEARYPLPAGFSLAFFGEAGLLARDLRDVGVDKVRWDVGAGTRYASAVGPLRFDVAVRPLYPEDAGPLDVTGCLFGDDRAVRVGDVFSLGPNRDPAQRKVPFALGASISIGQGAL